MDRCYVYHCGNSESEDKLSGRSLVPACVIAGVIGFILMNTCGLGGSKAGDYGYISGQLYTFLFINMGVTLAAKKLDTPQKERSKI